MNTTVIAPLLKKGDRIEYLRPWEEWIQLSVVAVETDGLTTLQDGSCFYPHEHTRGLLWRAVQ